MAKDSTSSIIFDRRRRFQNPSHLPSPLVLSDFISSSTLNPKYPLNYPYNDIYSTSTLWDGADRKDVVKKEEFVSKELWWWQPSQDSIPSEFLEASSMHGLKYVSQPKRHLIERLFWLLSFIACVIGAVIMISEIWQRYYDNPVIVTFNPIEQEVDVIPFPAVTICNTNPFKRSQVDKYACKKRSITVTFSFPCCSNQSKQYKEGATKQERMAALDALRVINAICSTQKSFLKRQNFAPRRGEIAGIPEAKENPSLESEKRLTKFILRNTQPCSELLRICVWEQQNIDCEKLFKPIITDYGKCCTFNMLPQELMEHYNSSYLMYGDDTITRAWRTKDLDEWKKWDYDNDGYLISPNLTYPYRQRRAGSADGLSILIDPDLEDSFCPSTDSLGIKVLYHVPLDAPRLANHGSVVGVNQEVYMEVNPDLTIADEGIESYSSETRKCYFGGEYPLSFYKPYTKSNCMEECWSDILLKTCNCVLYYTPRNLTTSVCSTNTASLDFQCIKRAEERFVGTLHKFCKYCKYSCNDLTYNAEVTGAQLQPYRELWADSFNATKPQWMSHRISIVHIFMGADSTVPKLRQKLYQTVDLIANTGGLLGLSIGFSVLSAVEVIYFATIRVCCKRVRLSERFGVVGQEEAVPTTNDTDTIFSNKNRFGITKWMQ